MKNRVSLRRIGYAIIKDGNLDMIFVRPKHRGKGYASKLLTYCRKIYPGLTGIAGSEEGDLLLKKFEMKARL